MQFVATAMTDDGTRAVALALLTESTESRVRILAPHSLSQSERNAAAILRLLAVVKETGFEDDQYAVAHRLAEVTANEVTAFDLALGAIGNTRWYRALGICTRVLLKQIDATSHDDRMIELLLRIERYGKLVNRLLFQSGDIVGDLERNLSHYLDNQHDAVNWQRRPVFVEPRDAILAAEATHFVGGDAGLFVYLLRDCDALASSLDEWIRAQGPSECFAARTRRAIQAYPRRHERGWFHGMPPDLAFGMLRSERDAWIPALEQLRGMHLDVAVAKLAEHYTWALVKWPNTMQESAVAWISSDPMLADAWDGTLRRHAGQQTLIATYRHLDSLQARAGGAQFGEVDGYGEAALVAAQDDPWRPWLIVEIGESSGHSWRWQTARLTAGATAVVRPHGWPMFVGVYRVDDLEAYRALWRDMDKDSGIVRATVCGHHDPANVLESFVATGFRSGFRETNFLSRRHGWAYTHVYGGGSNEHHAMFHAEDPAMTNRIVEYAAAQPGWYLSGRW